MHELIHYSIPVKEYLLSSEFCFSLTGLLGSGQFGAVHKGEWVAPGVGGKLDVAVKTLKEGAGEQDKVTFLQEAAIMGQFSHPNVVKLHGIITEGEPVSSSPLSLYSLTAFNY